MGDDKSIFALDALRNIYALVLSHTKLPRERWEDRFLTYPIPKLNVGDKILVRSHLEICVIPGVMLLIMWYM